MKGPRTAPLGASILGQQALNVLYLHRLVSTHQMHRMLTPHHTRAEYMRRQLQRLRADGLVDAVSRRAHGQPDLLWWLTEKGASAVEAVGLLTPRPYRMSPEAAAGPLQEHTLATVETGLAFVAWARRLQHECGPLDWSPEIAHYYRGEDKPGEDLALIPDAVLHYLHTDGRQRTHLTFFIEVDRAQMTVARLAQKLHAYARYRDFVPQTSNRGARFNRTRHTAATPAWRSRYPAYPRVLLVLTGASPGRLQRRIADLRSLVAANPALAGTAVRAGATTLEQLQEEGPFAPIFTPLLGSPELADARLTPTRPVAAAA
jgi:hypothetical protein